MIKKIRYLFLSGIIYSSPLFAGNSPIELAQKFFPEFYAVLTELKSDPPVNLNAFLSKWTEEDFHWFRASLYNHARLVGFEHIDKTHVYASLIEILGAIHTRRFFQRSIHSFSSPLLGINEELLYYLNNRIYALCDYLVYRIEGDKLVVEGIMEAKAGHYNKLELAQLHKFLRSLAENGLTVPVPEKKPQKFNPENIMMHIQGKVVPIEDVTAPQAMNAVVIVGTTAQFEESDFLHVVYLNKPESLKFMHDVANTLHQKVVVGPQWYSKFTNAEKKLKGDVVRGATKEVLSEAQFFDSFSDWVELTQMNQGLNPEVCDPKDKDLLTFLAKWLYQQKHMKSNSALTILTMKLSAAAQQVIRDQVSKGNENAKKFIPDSNDEESLKKLVIRVIGDETLSVEQIGDVFGHGVMVLGASLVYNEAVIAATKGGRSVHKDLRFLKKIASSEPDGCPNGFKKSEKGRRLE